MGKDGLKRVSNRRDDALSRTRWDRLESLLADYYRAQGYRVEHVGTGATRGRSDGGVDLKLYKDYRFIVVQCKGWNVYKVPHNDVHELIGVMMTSRATGAIFVTAGEYTAAAVRKAREVPNLQLIDGDELRRMLGPLPEPDVREASWGLSAPDASPHGFKGFAGAVASAAGERLLIAAEDRIRHGRGGRRIGGGIVGSLIVGKLIGAAIGFAVLLLALYIMVNALKGIGTVAERSVRQSQSAQRPASAASRRPAPESRRQGATRMQPAAVPAYRPPTEAEIRESQRKADEAMKVLEPSTPEM